MQTRHGIATMRERTGAARIQPETQSVGRRSPRPFLFENRGVRFRLQEQRRLSHERSPPMRDVPIMSIRFAMAMGFAFLTAVAREPTARNSQSASPASTSLQTDRSACTASSPAAPSRRGSRTRSGRRPWRSARTSRSRCCSSRSTTWAFPTRSSPRSPPDSRRRRACLASGWRSARRTPTTAPMLTGVAPNIFGKPIIAEEQARIDQLYAWVCRQAGARLPRRPGRPQAGDAVVGEGERGVRGQPADPRRPGRSQPAGPEGHGRRRLASRRGHELRLPLHDASTLPRTWSTATGRARRRRRSRPTTPAASR